MSISGVTATSFPAPPPSHLPAAHPAPPPVPAGVPGHKGDHPAPPPPPVPVPSHPHEPAEPALTEVPKPPPLPPLKALTVDEVRAMLGVPAPQRAETAAEAKGVTPAHPASAKAAVHSSYGPHR